jgi:hypothetical protein
MGLANVVEIVSGDLFLMMFVMVGGLETAEVGVEMFM